MSCFFRHLVLLTPICRLVWVLVSLFIVEAGDFLELWCSLIGRVVLREGVAC